MAFNPKYFNPWSPQSVGWETNGDSRRNQEPYRSESRRNYRPHQDRYQPHQDRYQPHQDRFRPKQDRYHQLQPDRYSEDYNNSYKNRRQRPYGSGHRYGQNSYQERWKSRDYYKGKNQEKNKPLHSDSDRLLAALDKAADNVTKDVNAQRCAQRVIKEVKVEHSTTSKLDKTIQNTQQRPYGSGHRYGQNYYQERWKSRDYYKGKNQEKNKSLHSDSDRLLAGLSKAADNVTNDVNAQRCAQRATKENKVKVEHSTTSDASVDRPLVQKETEEEHFTTYKLDKTIQKTQEATEQSVHPSFHLTQEEDEYDVKIGKAREQMINATKCTNLYRGIQEYNAKNLPGKADPQTPDPANPTTRWKEQYKAWRLQLAIFGHMGGIELDEEDAEL